MKNEIIRKTVAILGKEKNSNPDNIQIPAEVIKSFAYKITDRVKADMALDDKETERLLNAVFSAVTEELK